MAGEEIKDRIRFSNGDLVIVDKLPGEDSEKIPDMIDGDLKVILRLDKPVCGLLPMIRSGIDQGRYRLTKTYLAIVKGDPGAGGRMNDLLFHDKRTNKTFIVKRMRKGVKQAVLDYETVGYDEENDLSLVRIHLLTGRTHQIRIQFGSRHMPLAGDGKYGSRIKCPFVALMAYEIKVEDMTGGKAETVTAKIPDAFPWDLFQW